MRTYYFFLFFGLLLFGIAIGISAVPKYTFAFPLFESTSGYGGGGCDDPLFSGVVPVPNAEVSSFDRISFSVPLTTPNESIRVEVNGSAVSYLIFQNFFRVKRVIALLPAPITTPGTVRIALFAALSSECPKSFVYDVFVKSASLPLPTCTLDAFPSAIYSGQKSTLRWSTINATWATLEGESLSEESGERYVFPETTTTYHMNVGNSEGTASCQVQVTILPPPRPSCSLLASSRWIHRGESTTLSWTTQYAEYGWLLQQSVSLPTGSQRVSPSRTTLYILTVLNASGLNICTDVVWVSL